MDAADRAEMPPRALRVYSVITVVATLLLLYTGGFVTTIGAGLAVPDWPLSFGSLNPAGWWQDAGVRAEHGHRLTGAAVGTLCLLLSIAIWRSGRARHLRRPAALLIGLILLQAVLGGLRVLDRNIVLAMIHGCLAQIVFSVLVFITWRLSVRPRPAASTGDRLTLIIAGALPVVVFLQLLIGAVMRHLGAGLAISSFPLIDGALWPDTWSWPVTVHYLHRLWAAVVVVTAAAVFLRLQAAAVRPETRLLAASVFSLVMVQAALGAMVIVGRRGLAPTTLHVMVGALILGGSLVCWLSLQPRRGSFPVQHAT